MSYITLDEVHDVQRDENGKPWTWRGGKAIAEFRTEQQARDYVDEHIKELPADCAFFAPSASLLGALNAYLAQKQKELRDAS